MNQRLMTKIMASKFALKAAPKIGSAALTLKSVSPDLYLGAGLISGVASGVMFAKAYRRHDEVFSEIKEDLLEAKETVVELSETEETRLTNKEVANLLAPIYGEMVGSAIRLYGPAAVSALLSVYLILLSHGILKNRNKGLVAALTIFEKGFAEYRKRVIEEHGEEADERYFHGADQRTTVTVTDEDGKKKKTKGSENAIPEEASSLMYSRIFDDSNPEFSPDKDVNDFFLRAQMRYLNDILIIKGHVMLNDVYDALHMPRSPEGAVVGWSLKSNGDKFIDFGLDKPINKRPGDNRFVLDFNVNGVVYKYI